MSPKALIFFICLLAVKITSGQDIGIRLCTGLSTNARINLPKGFGIYFTADNSAKVDWILSSDFCWKYSIFPEEGYESNAYKFQIAIGPLYKVNIYKGAFLKIGPSLSYQKISGSNAGLVSNWLGPFSSYSAGLGIISNFKLERILRSRINFDLFISPKYFFDIKSDGNNPTDKKSKNLFFLELNSGLSFFID